MKIYEESSILSVVGSGRRLGRLTLLVAEGPDKGAAIELHPGVFTIGQGDECDLVLRDPSVAREHLEVTVSDRGVEIRDLGSPPGSFFEGARFDSVQLGPSGAVAIGATELRLVALPVDGSILTTPRETQAGAGPVEVDRDLPFKEAKERLVQRWERDYVTRLMSDTGGNVTHAARRAGMNRVHLYRLLKKHGFDRAA